MPGAWLAKASPDPHAWCLACKGLTKSTCLVPSMRQSHQLYNNLIKFYIQNDITALVHQQRESNTIYKCTQIISLKETSFSLVWCVLPLPSSCPPPSCHPFHPIDQKQKNEETICTQVAAFISRLTSITRITCTTLFITTQCPFDTRHIARQWHSSSLCNTVTNVVNQSSVPAQPNSHPLRLQP